MIKISIDVTLLDKARFKNFTRKNGQTAKFCDLVLIETSNGKDDFLVKQDTTQEERANKVQMPILGNGRHVGERNATRPKPAAQNYEGRQQDDSGDDIPF